MPSLEPLRRCWRVEVEVDSEGVPWSREVEVEVPRNLCVGPSSDRACQASPIMPLLDGRVNFRRETSALRLRSCSAQHRVNKLAKDGRESPRSRSQCLLQRNDIIRSICTPRRSITLKSCRCSRKPAFSLPGRTTQLLAHAREGYSE